MNKKGKKGSKFHVWDQIVVRDKDDNSLKYYKLNEKQKLANPFITKRRKNLNPKEKSSKQKNKKEKEIKPKKSKNQPEKKKFRFDFESHFIFSIQEDKREKEDFKKTIDLMNQFPENEYDEEFFDEDF